MTRGQGWLFRFGVAIAAVISLTSSSSTSAHTQPARASRPKLDRALERLAALDAETNVRVIVTARPGRRGEVKGALANRALSGVLEEPLADALVAEVPGKALRELAGDPRVSHVSLDAPVRSFQATELTVPLLANNMLLPTLGLPDGRFTGAGVGVAVLDSGIVAHSELPVAAFYDFVAKGGALTKAIDLFGHGTHVAGMIMDKQGKSDARYRSVAKGVRLIGMRVLDQNGSGYTSTVIQAINFAVQNRQQLGVDVINLSLGHVILESAATDPLVQAVERAVRAGIVVVVAAGNQGTNAATGATGYAGITSPGNAPSAITVAPFSSRGPTWYDAYAKPDIVAPGRRVVSFMAKKSPLYSNYPAYRVDVATRTYMTLSGTSMAASVTTGVVALMIEASRTTNAARVGLSPNAVKAILQYSAVPLPDVDPLTQGAGSLNAAGALALAGSIDPTRPQGAWWLTTGVSPVTPLANGETLDWSQRVHWGEGVLEGELVYVHEPAWAQAIVWGNSIIWGNSIVSGNAIVWGNTIVWGNAIVWGNTVLGQSAGGGVLYGDDADWYSVMPNAIVWGNLNGAMTGTSANPSASWSPVF
jgi:serine protease AprX